jgi:hypothetical protein
VTKKKKVFDFSNFIQHDFKTGNEPLPFSCSETSLNPDQKSGSHPEIQVDPVKSFIAGFDPDKMLLPDHLLSGAKTGNTDNGKF